MKTKKIVSLLLSMAVMLTSLSLLCIGASAVEVQTQIDIPDRAIESEEDYGKYTYELDGVEYIVIRSADEMNAAATANAEGGKNYILDADLDYTRKEFVRIHLANGIFNGNGHSITGVNINMTATDGGNNLSMFMFKNDATVTVSNLTVGAPENPVTVTGTAATATNGTCRVGTLFGYLQSTATFENVTVYSNVSADGTFRVGGFIGEARSKITMKNCVFNGNVTVRNSNNECPAGGLIGHCYNMSAANIENCASYGTVSSTVYAGGLIGGFTNTITMTNCANYASVSAEKCAGLIADAGEKVSGKVTITSCFNAGAVTGTTSAAGLIGTVSKHANEAYNNTTLINCANIGTVTATTTANDLIATTYPDSKVTVTNCGAFVTAGAFKTYEIVKAKGGEATTTTADKTAAEALTFMTIYCSYAMFGIEDNKLVVKTVPAEAKFLQYKKDTDANTMDIRVLGVINASDLSKYTNVGFNVSVYDANGDAPVLLRELDPALTTTTTVYKSVNANEGGTITTYSALDLGATYLYALELQNIPMEGKYVFEITAFATETEAEGGATVSDSVVTVTVVDGKIQ